MKRCLCRIATSSGFSIEIILRTISLNYVHPEKQIILIDIFKSDRPWNVPNAFSLNAFPHVPVTRVGIVIIYFALNAELMSDRRPRCCFVNGTSESVILPELNEE